MAVNSTTCDPTSNGTGTKSRYASSRKDRVMSAKER